jgi:hypothetical protein
MTKQKSKVASNIGDIAATADPALIPTAVYHAEAAMAHHASDAFVSREMLDRMLPLELREQLVAKIGDVQLMVEEARNLINNQTGRGRAALGKGFRNYGFMMASNQSINNFPQLAPNFIDISTFNDLVEDYLFARDVSERMIALSNDMRDMMNIFGDLSFNFALAYYANVRSIAQRTNDHTATSVFEILRRFFNRRRTPLTDQTSEAQLELDLQALMHSAKDGQVEN